MATLCLADDSRTFEDTRSAEPAWAAPALREWLAGEWGMLFSHPDDFQYQGLEYDRWFTILREEFQTCRVRPLACATRANVRDASWVSGLIGDWRVIPLHGAKPRGARLQRAKPHGASAADEVFDLTAHLLGADIAALRSRFVLIVDATLRRRGVLCYSPGRPRVSPLDLLASISVLRRQPAVRARQAA